MSIFPPRNSGRLEVCLSEPIVGTAEAMVISHSCRSVRMKRKSVHCGLWGGADPQRQFNCTAYFLATHDRPLPVLDYSYISPSPHYCVYKGIRTRLLRMDFSYSISFCQPLRPCKAYAPFQLHRRARRRSFHFSRLQSQI